MLEEPHGEVQDQETYFARGHSGQGSGRQNAALDDRMAELDEDILRLVRAAEPEPRKELVF